MKLHLSPFEHLAHVRQVHFNTVFIFIGLYIHITKVPRCAQFVDGYRPQSITSQMVKKVRTHSLGQGGDPQRGSRKSCIWITHSRPGKHGGMVRERTPAF